MKKVIATIIAIILLAILSIVALPVVLVIIGLFAVIVVLKIAYAIASNLLFAVLTAISEKVNKNQK